LFGKHSIRATEVNVANDALLWLFVMFGGIAVGAGLYEMRINVPRWFAPRSPTPVNVSAIQADDSGRRFWAFVTTGPLTLLTLSGLAVTWNPVTARDQWWMAAAGLTLVERIGTFAYFIPQLLRLLQPERLTQERGCQAATRWIRLNYLRGAVALVAWLAALRALSLSN